jgi:hypothetical protein
MTRRRRRRRRRLHGVTSPFPIPIYPHKKIYVHME